MPTVFRFLTILAVLVAAAYGAMFLLIALVEPRKSEISVNVPLDQVAPPTDRTGTIPPPGGTPTDTPPETLPAPGSP